MKIDNLISGMQGVQQSQDGTLKGGFVSVTGGRYRIVIGGDNPHPQERGHNGSAGSDVSCAGSNNDSCENWICPGTTNRHTSGAGPVYCDNVSCAVISNGNYTSQIA